LFDATQTKYLETRFERFVSPEPNSGCWLWTGAGDRDGYGNFSVNRKFISAHRFSYGLYTAKIPSGFEIDHLCHVRCCVNPAHLEAVTRAENIRRQRPRGKRTAFNTHCFRGHERDRENTYISPTGTRHCRKCNRIAGIKYKRKTMRAA
jgi:hypothetical protein